MSGRPEVWIKFAPDDMGGMYVCGDEDGEFARSNNVTNILAYVEELIYGPGTVRSMGLRAATENLPRRQLL